MSTQGNKVALLCVLAMSILNVTVVGSCAGPLEIANPDASAAAAANADATYIGEEMCKACHSLETAHWSETIHAEVFRNNPRTALEHQSCEACHGPGSEHLKATKDPTKILGFTRESGREIAEMNGACLQCHESGPRLHWFGSIHESEDLACSDCHNPMTRTSTRGLLRETTIRATCFTCHPKQRTDFRKRSHMPLHEGKIECTDCHQPHGSATDPLLTAQSNFELCTGCHADKRGPFLWEHAPVVESCANCHLPHGSNRDFLLSSSPPFLCQQCHAQPGHPTHLLTAGNQAGAFPESARDPRLMGRGCVTCHAKIHGSNHPSGARFHR